jgi:hypothetical protein
VFVAASTVAVVAIAAAVIVVALVVWYVLPPGAEAADGVRLAANERLRVVPVTQGD